MLDLNTLNSDITKIDVMQLQRMISMENKVFEDMYRLMLYDKFPKGKGKMNGFAILAFFPSAII